MASEKANVAEKKTPTYCRSDGLEAVDERLVVRMMVKIVQAYIPVESLPPTRHKCIPSLTVREESRHCPCTSTKRGCKPWNSVLSEIAPLPTPLGRTIANLVHGVGNVAPHESPTKTSFSNAHTRVSTELSTQAISE